MSAMPIDPTDEPERVALSAARALEVARLRPLRPEPQARPIPVAGDLPELEQTLEHDRMVATWTTTVPKRFRGARLQHFDGEVGQELAEWAEDPRGRNLVLLGPVGVGKTYAATAATRERIRVGASPIVVPCVELLDQLRPGGPDDALHRFSWADLLVLDDLGSERATDWTAERLYAVVNRRWMEELPIVATLNYELDQLSDVLGERVASRLTGSGAVVLRLTGDDRRMP